MKRFPSLPYVRQRRVRAQSGRRKELLKYKTIRSTLRDEYRSGVPAHEPLSRQLGSLASAVSLQPGEV